METLLVEELSDEDLVPRLAAGEEAAIQAFLDRYWARAYRVALRLQGDPGSAEDVAQEAVLETLRSAPSFDAGRSFRPWFFTILRRAASNHRRSEARRKKREQVAARPERSTPSLRENLEAVQVYLARLKPELREVLTLHFLEGLSHREVAVATGCPTGTVTYRIQSGIQKLRASLRASPAMLALPFFDQLTAEIDEGSAPASPVAAELAAELLRLPLAPPPPRPSGLIKAVKPAGALVKTLAGIGLLLGSLAPIILLQDGAPPTTSAQTSGEEGAGLGPAAPGEDRAAAAAGRGQAPLTSGPGAAPLAASARYRGRLTLQGQGFAGARVRLITAKGSREAQSDADGRFALALAAAPSALEVEVRCPRPWSREEWSAVALQSADGRRARLLWPEGSEEVAVALAPRQVQGRVFWAEEERPIVKGQLWLPGGAVPLEADGGFDRVIPRLAGYEAVWVSAEGAAVAGACLKPDDVTRDMAEMFREMTKEGVEDNPLLSMMQSMFGGLGEEYAKKDADRIVTRLSIPLHRGGELRGRVVDERGLPISGARLALRSTIPSAFFNSGLPMRERALFSADSDQAGRFHFRFIPLEGKLSSGAALRVSAAGYAASERSGLRPGAIGDVRLEPLSELKGQVVDSAGGALVAELFRVDETAGRFVVELSSEESRGRAKVVDRYRRGARFATDSEGRFRLETPAGRARWLVVAPGFADRVLELEAPGFGERIALAPGARLRGRVRSPVSSGDFSHTELRLFPAGALASVPHPMTMEGIVALPAALALALADTEGRFSFEGLTAGRYDLLAIATGLDAETDALSFGRVALRRGVEAGSEQVFTAQDFGSGPSTPSFVLRVFDEDGQAIRKGVILVARTEDGRHQTLAPTFSVERECWIAVAVFGLKGRVRLAALAPGRPPRLTPWLDAGAGGGTADGLSAIDGGDLVLVRGGGRLRIRPEAAPPPDTNLIVTVRDPETGLVIEQAVSAEGAELSLSPGEGELRAELTGEAPQRDLAAVPFEIIAGQTTELRLSLAAKKKK